MARHDNPPPYYAFLLRCWQERSQSNQQLDQWRFSLEDPRSGARRGFATLDAVLVTVREALLAEEADEQQGLVRKEEGLP